MVGTQDKKEFIFTLQIMGWNSSFPETTKQSAGKAMPNQAKLSEPQHDKTNKMAVRPAKTQISLGIRPVWSESSRSAWRTIGSLATY